MAQLPGKRFCIQFDHTFILKCHQLETALSVNMSPPNKPPNELSKPTVGRLSLYYRELQRLTETNLKSINSQQIAGLVNVTPAVVRRDLNTLGAKGRRGVGYSIKDLIEKIGTTLGSGMQWRVVLVGVGSLGHALLRYRGFQKLGFQLEAAYDCDDEKIGMTIEGVTIQSVSSLALSLQTKSAELGILAVPAETASGVASELINAGVRGILNFAPTTLRFSEDVAVINVDLAVELQRLTFDVKTQEPESAKTPRLPPSPR